MREQLVGEDNGDLRDDDDDNDNDKHGSDSDAPSDVEFTPDHHASAASVLEDGRVLCPLPPYEEYTVMQLGRITSWPVHVPLPKGSISCACYLHDHLEVSRDTH